MSHPAKRDWKRNRTGCIDVADTVGHINHRFFVFRFVPVVAKFGDVEKVIGTLTLRAASLEGRKAGYPVDPSLNDLIWMDFLLGNYERIICEISPSEV